MKRIKITLEAEGNQIDRGYTIEESIADIDWQPVIESMYDTLRKSHDKKF